MGAKPLPIASIANALQYAFLVHFRIVNFTSRLHATIIGYYMHLGIVSIVGVFQANAMSFVGAVHV